jgi:hypothetical protein
MGRLLIERFTKIGKLPYTKQAIFFLNGLWAEHHQNAEKVWEFAHGIVKMDPKGENGFELEEFEAHKFLEAFAEPMTALELRDHLKKIDLNEDHHMSLLEFLVDHFKAKIELLMSRPQDFNMDDKKDEADIEKLIKMANEEIERAKEALNHVNEEIKKLEATKHDLEQKSALDGVKGRTAKQQLYALLNEDPTALNAAVLHAEAAVRKARKMMEEIINGGKTTLHTQGTMWWMDRELAEAKKYKPKGNLKISDTFSA